MGGDDKQVYYFTWPYIAYVYTYFDLYIYIYILYSQHATQYYCRHRVATSVFTFNISSANGAPLSSELLYLYGSLLFSYIAETISRNTLILANVFASGFSSGFSLKYSLSSTILSQFASDKWPVNFWSQRA